VRGAEPHGGTERRRMPLVEDALAVDRGQDRDAVVGQRANPTGRPARAAAGEHHGACRAGDRDGDGGDGGGPGPHRVRHTPHGYGPARPLALEHVDRHLDVDRARPAGGETLEDRRDGLGDLVGVLDPDAAPAHRVERGLLILHLVQPAGVGAHQAPGRSGRDGQCRHRVGVRGRQRGDGVGDARTRGGDEHSRATADPGIAVRRVAGALLVPGDHVPHAGVRQMAVELEIVRPGYAEHVADAVRDQRVDDGRAAGHPVSHGWPAGRRRRPSR